MPGWVTIGIVTCSLLLRDNNLPREQRGQVARIEAEAFLTNVRPHIALETLLAIAYVESRFNPLGSQTDRDHAMWGVMQLSDPAVVCRGRRGHDDPRRCSAAIAARRALLLDPATNIRLGAAQLAWRWRQNQHAGALWVGAYYWGSVPPNPRSNLRFMAYVRRVHSAERIMRARLARCRTRPATSPPSEIDRATACITGLFGAAALMSVSRTSLPRISSASLRRLSRTSPASSSSAGNPQMNCTETEFGRPGAPSGDVRADHAGDERGRREPFRRGPPRGEGGEASSKSIDATGDSVLMGSALSWVVRRAVLVARRRSPRRSSGMSDPARCERASSFPRG